MKYAQFAREASAHLIWMCVEEPHNATVEYSLQNIICTREEQSYYTP